MNLEKGLLLFLVFQKYKFEDKSVLLRCAYDMVLVIFKKGNYLEKELQYLKGYSY